MLSEATSSFINDLRANNEKAWFEEHRHRDQADFKNAAEQFADALNTQLSVATGQELKTKIFRIFRDLRFSKDKTPYNAHLHIGFSPQGYGPDAPAYMFGLEPDRLVLGAGTFAFTPRALQIWREWLDDEEGDRLDGIFADMSKRGFERGEPDLKRVPAPYDNDHARADLLRHKGLAIWKSGLGPSACYGQEGVHRVADELLNVQPFCDWLIRLSRTAAESA